MNKGGRIPKDKRHIIARRREVARSLLVEGMSKADIALFFNVHPSQIVRLLK